MAQTATVQIQMPEMGESVTEGIVLEWHVAEGDFVSEGDTVVEVSTDKVDAEVPAPADGVITKLLVSVDDEVPVGAPMAEMEPGEGTDEGSDHQAAGPVAGQGGPAGGSTPSSTPPAPRHPQRNGDEGQPLPEIDSCCELFPTAEFQEREAYDFFGIVFRGHPDLTRILLPDNYVGWPQRRDFPVGGEPVTFTYNERNYG
jgi:pyruvate/2-oxoglutarate dehydrogenase complex dihydrolipoamide acyltransferase (E2) component